MTTLRAIGLDAVELCPAMVFEAPAAMRFSNHVDTAPAFARHLRQVVYAPRLARLAPISLVRLPPETVMFGGGNFVVASNNSFLAEQFPPRTGDEYDQVDALTPLELPALDVESEVLLVARYGAGTWGHWLGELLPKIVLAERAFPGRFDFLLPAQVLDEHSAEAIWGRIRQSLVACGIALERVIAADPELNYRFAALYAVTPVWSDQILHPGAAQALREAVAAIPKGSDRKLVLLRDQTAGRVLENREVVHGMLTARGFALCAIGSLDFDAQVAAFKGASSIFAVLGSDLSGLVFAPPGVRVIAASPDVFGDWFFYGLVLERGGQFADLRGEIIQKADIPHRGSFAVPQEALTTALHVLSA